MLPLRAIQDEEIVNSYMSYLKWREFQSTKATFIPSRPIQEYLAEIQSSKVYEVLKKFPKGGSLHLHHTDLRLTISLMWIISCQNMTLPKKYHSYKQNAPICLNSHNVWRDHVVSKSILLDIILSSSLYDNLYFKTSGPNRWKLDFFLNPPIGWSKVKDSFTNDSPKSILLPHLIFTRVMDDKAIHNPTDSAIRWQQMSPLFDRAGASLVDHANITSKHMEAMLKGALDENVQYLETKSSAGRKMYVLDPSQTETNGKRFIDDDNGEMELKAVDSVVKNFIMKHPEFIRYKRVISSHRGSGKVNITKDLYKAVNLYEKHPQLIAGYDLVAEEDLGHSLLFFQDDFNTLLAAHDKLPYFFHTGETNWPDDLSTSVYPEDPISTAANLYDAIILGAKRIGHGIALANHPYLMEVLKSKKIAIEANPVSNMLLGYVQDQRHHPAITYFRYGVPVVISADDPSTFGYDSFTIDWYEAFMGWGLDLADLRQLATNSLQYSAMSSDEKMNAYAKWSGAWNKFIQDMKNEACGIDFKGTEPFIGSIFPKEGCISIDTEVQVFGRNFERSICQTVLCKFGDETSKGRYLSNNLITCHSPGNARHQKSSRPRVVPFSISFDNGNTFYSSNLTFSFVHKMK